MKCPWCDNGESPNQGSDLDPMQWEMDVQRWDFIQESKRNPKLQSPMFRREDNSEVEVEDHNSPTERLERPWHEEPKQYHGYDGQ